LTAVARHLWWRRQINGEQTPARFSAGTLKRIDRVLKAGERHSDLLRNFGRSSQIDFLRCTSGLATACVSAGSIPSSNAIDIASSLIRAIGFDPVVIGGLAMGKCLVPGTPLSGEHRAAEIRQIVTNLH